MAISVSIEAAELMEHFQWKNDTECTEHIKNNREAVADELASAAELAMGKTAAIPAALIQGFSYPEGEGYGREIVRPPENDLFR